MTRSNYRKIAKEMRKIAELIQDVCIENELSSFQLTGTVDSYCVEMFENKELKFIDEQEIKECSYDTLEEIN